MAPPPPELLDELVGEILLRLPADEPAHLFRASLVCKRWLRIVTDPAFLRLYRAFHGTPPLLGLLHRLRPIYGDPPAVLPRFAPTTASSPAFPHPAPASAPGSPHPQALDCRHGRVLLAMMDESLRFLVWDPVTGDRHCLPGPNIAYLAYSGAVLCAAAGCDHLDCHGSPFRVAFLGTDARYNMVWASLYSSKTGGWTAPISLFNGPDIYVQATRPSLIGDEIFFALSHGVAIGKFDWVKNCLSVVVPAPPKMGDWFALLEMDDSSLGFARIEDSGLCLWSRRVNAEGNAEWVRCRVIELEAMMPMANPGVGAFVVGFAEGVNVIFVKTGVGLFMMELKSGRATKIDGDGDYYAVLPYMSFYTPGHCRLSSLARIC